MNKFLEAMHFAHACKIFDENKKIPRDQLLEILEAGRLTYLVASSMVNCAAFMGIDSCCIEGFQREELEKLLQINTQKERIALVLTFGYRVKDQKTKYRLSLENLIEFRD